MKARGINENKLRVFSCDNAGDAVSRRLRLVGNNCDLLTDQSVHQRRLADIRSTRNRDHGSFTHNVSPK